MQKLKLTINRESCGKWGLTNMINILKDYPQSNFTEWQLLNTFFKHSPTEVCINMVCKVWYPAFDPWDRVMCDWTIGNNSFTARDGNQVNHGKNHCIQLPSMKIWNTTVGGKLVRLHGPTKSYVVTTPYYSAP